MTDLTKKNVDDDAIDLYEVLAIVKSKAKKIAKIIGGIFLVALLLALLLHKSYTSTVTLQTKSPAGANSALQAAAAMFGIGGGASSNPIVSYQEMIKTRHVLEPVIAKLALPEEEKEKMTAAGFFKKYIKTENPKGTSFIHIKVKGDSPEEAQQIAEWLTESFQQTLTDLSRSEQSDLLKFLRERRMIAEEELAKSELILKEFSQKSKIYAPEDQAKVLLEALGELDKRSVETEISLTVENSRLKEINKVLQEQNFKMENFQISEHPLLESLRKQIIDQEVALFNARQQYTDKHPDILLAEERLQSLSEKLQTEIAKTIKAGMYGTDSISSTILVEKIKLETGTAVAKVALEALRSAKSTADSKMSTFTDDSIEYIRLKRNLLVAQEVYANIVKQYEQTRIQEAMDSMAIQVVDKADLPKNQSFPNLLLFLVGGLAIGMLVSGVYVMVLYLKRR